MAGEKRQFVNDNKIEITIFLLLVVGIVFWTCALFLPNWTVYTHPYTTDEYHYGPFITCLKQNGKTLCMSAHLDLVRGVWSNVVRVFSSFKGCFYLLALITAFILMFWTEIWRKRFLYATAVFALITGLLGIITIVVYSEAHRELVGFSYKHDFAFYFAIVSTVISLIVTPIAAHRAMTYTWKSGWEDDDFSFNVAHFLQREATNNFGPMDTKINGNERWRQNMRRDLEQSDLTNGKNDVKKDAEKTNPEPEQENEPENKKKKKGKRMSGKNKNVLRAYKNLKYNAKSPYLANI